MIKNLAVHGSVKIYDIENTDVAEVKDIMDEAMAHSQKVSAKKLVKRVLGKNTDDADRIILTEKDFNI